MNDQKDLISSKLSHALGTAIAVLTVLLALAFFLGSMLGTYTVRMQTGSLYNYEIKYHPDQIFRNLIVLCSVAGLLWLLCKVRVSRRAAWLVAGGALLIVAAVGMCWVHAAAIVPESDQAVLYEYAQQFVHGDYSAILGGDGYDYLRVYPFQLGFLTYLEAAIRLFGETALPALPLLNVLWLVLAYAAVIATADAMLMDARVTLLTTLLLMGSLPPVLACTLIYANIPALACSCWGIYFVVRYDRMGHARLLLPTVVLLALSAVLKPNYLIVLIACGIILLLAALKNKKLRPALVGIACTVVLYLLSTSLIQSGYERRAGAKAGDGMPQLSWMVMGMQQGSTLPPGWYNRYALNVYHENSGDMERVNARMHTDLRERLHTFASNPMLTAKFFAQKFYSQWNEPTFQSIWVSRMATPLSGQWPRLVIEVYEGTAADWLTEYCNQYVQVLYFGFLLFTLSLCKTRKEILLLLPLTILGGGMYHLLFEAKSLYALTYLPLFAPCAAGGIARISADVTFCRKKTVPPAPMKKGRLLP
ncbi:MAG: hypothetical protein RR224_01310 [Clostridia bacterium]